MCYPLNSELDVCLGYDFNYKEDLYSFRLERQIPECRQLLSEVMKLENVIDNRKFANVLIYTIMGKREA